MKLIYEDSKFICETTYDERMIPKSAGFRWNPDEKYWWSDDLMRAVKLKDYAVDEAVKILDDFEKERDQKLEASKATDSNVDIPAPKGLEYLPYQKAGIAFGLKNDNILIGDEMGLGKTIQALGVINADQTIKKILVICPASLKLNWKREADKWLIGDYSVRIADSKESFPSSNVIIINYDIIKKFKSYINGIEWDLMIVDECHYLKNTKAQRTQLVLGKKMKKNGQWIWKHEPIKAKRKIALTGTPIVNKPVELWPIVNALDPEQFSNFFYFAKRYCNAFQTRYGWDMTGAANLEELQEKLRMSIMVRRLKADVLTELPPKRRQVIELPANGCAAIIDNEKRAWGLQEEALRQLKINVELAKASENPQDYEDAVEKLKSGTSAAFAEISRLRHETALAKVPYVIEHIESAIEEGSKVVCFAHHRDVIAKIQEHFGNSSVTLIGGMKLEDRQSAVDRFQNDENIKLFIGSITAAGVGLTLTASSHVVFAEIDWVPGNLTQAEDRTHRIGQVNSVLVQHLVLEGSLDAKMAKTIVKKQNVIDKALDKKFEREQLSIPTIPNEPVKTSRREKIDKLAEEITDEEIPEIHENLKRLANVCNYATSEDGQGFNKIDAGVGHSLAESQFLTKRQAALGKMLCKKYRRQLEEF